MSTFGDVVRECRTAEGKSLSLVAELAGLTKSYIHDIEKGKKKSNPTIDTVMRLCHALNIAPSRLLNPAVEDWRTNRPAQKVILVKARVQMDSLS